MRKHRTDEALLDFGEAPLNIGDVAFYDACMRCGRCVQACPSTGAGEPFAPRDFIQATLQGLWQEHSPVGDIRFLTKDHPIDPNAPWYCTTCAACLEVCPVYGATFEAVSKKRAMLIQEGTGVPDLMNQTLERLFNYENPWVSSKREKGCLGKGFGHPCPGKGRERGRVLLLCRMHDLLRCQSPGDRQVLLEHLEACRGEFRNSWRKGAMLRGHRQSGWRGRSV